MATVDEIEKCLPQTQCGDCGFAGCRPYAEAIAQGAATIDGCPPGGIDTVKSLASLLDISSAPYEAVIQTKLKAPTIAVIREAECIGCTKCIQACPVDAIIGSSKQMHTIISDECTGCQLCVEPCPVDCIDMIDVDSLAYDPEKAHKRHHARQVRQLRKLDEKRAIYQEKKKLAKQANTAEKKAKLDYIQQALARVADKRVGMNE